MYHRSMKKQLVIYGTHTCTDCKRSKKWLDEHKVSYKEIFLEDDEKAIDFVLRINNGMQSVPTIVFPDKSILVEPSNALLEEKVRSLGLLHK